MFTLISHYLNFTPEHFAALDPFSQGIILWTVLFANLAVLQGLRALTKTQ